MSFLFLFASLSCVLKVSGEGSIIGQLEGIYACWMASACSLNQMDQGSVSGEEKRANARTRNNQTGNEKRTKVAKYITTMWEKGMSPLERGESTT